MDNLLLICKFHMQWWYLLLKLKASGYILYENVADRIPYIKFFKGRFPAHIQIVWQFMCLYGNWNTLSMENLIKSIVQSLVRVSGLCRKLVLSPCWYILDLYLSGIHLPNTCIWEMSFHVLIVKPCRRKNKTLISMYTIYTYYDVTPESQKESSVMW
jgi:hypothetical protein